MVLRIRVALRITKEIKLRKPKRLLIRPIEMIMTKVRLVVLKTEKKQQDKPTANLPA